LIGANDISWTRRGETLSPPLPPHLSNLSSARKRAIHAKS